MVEISRETDEVIREDQISEEDRQTLWAALIRDVVRNHRIDLPIYHVSPAAERA